MFPYIMEVEVDMEVMVMVDMVNIIQALRSFLSMLMVVMDTAFMAEAMVEDMAVMVMAPIVHMDTVEQDTKNITTANQPMEVMALMVVTDQWWLDTIIINANNYWSLLWRVYQSIILSKSYFIAKNLIHKCHSEFIFI